MKQEIHRIFLQNKIRYEQSDENSHKESNSICYLKAILCSLYIVHRCDRLEELFVLLNRYKFGVKKVQFVYSDINKEAIMVLIKAIKNANIGSLKVCAPLDISNLESYKGILNEVKE